MLNISNPTHLQMYLTKHRMFSMQPSKFLHCNRVDNNSGDMYYKDLLGSIIKVENHLVLHDLQCQKSNIMD